MPVPMAVAPGPAMGQPPGMAQRFGPPPGPQLPYWMQQPNAEAGVPVTSSTEAAPPTFAPPSQPAPAPGPGYGRAAVPGYFPGYGAPGVPSPMPQAGAGSGVVAAPPAAGPGGFQPQPYRPNDAPAPMVIAGRMRAVLGRRHACCRRSRARRACPGAEC